MPARPAPLVLTSPGATATAASSKEHKTFARLRQQLDELRHAVDDWHATVPAYHARAASDLHPLFVQYSQHRCQLLSVLDQGFQAKGLTARDRTKLSGLIAQMADEIINDGDATPEVVLLHDKHSDMSLEEKEREDVELMKAMASVFGTDTEDLGDDATAEEVAQRLRASMEGMRASSDHAAAADAASEPAPPRRSRKPSAKAQARQDREREDRQRVSQSLREVFRKLASALHPDRETDPQQRERKNTLMQKVNAAYEREDLLQLLELQLEVEHVDLYATASITDVHLRHFNKVLKEQVGELEQELQHLQMKCDAFEPWRKTQLEPGSVMQRLERDIEGMKENIGRAQRDAVELADPRKLKAWLKGCSLQLDSEADGLGFGNLDDMLAELIPAGRRR